MILKTFNSKTNSFEPITIGITESYVDKDTGTVNTIHKKFNSFNIIDEALDSKISKNGDIVNGVIQFGNGFGISGTSINGDTCSNSRVEYCEAQNSSESGFFRVIGSTKDISDFNSIPTEDYFNLVCDTAPTENSKNLITSGTLWSILQTIDSRLQTLEQ